MPYPTLPATLASGIVSIYGAGDSISTVSGLLTSPNIFFGEINQVSIYSAYSIGDSVMFPNGAVNSRVSYLNWTYTLLDETKIILTESAAL
jgi:hypothetical protein